MAERSQIFVYERGKLGAGDDGTRKDPLRLNVLKWLRVSKRGARDFGRRERRKGAFVYSSLQGFEKRRDL